MTYKGGGVIAGQDFFFLILDRKVWCVREIDSLVCYRDRESGVIKRKRGLVC